jgi:hypothetical protein
MTEREKAYLARNDRQPDESADAKRFRNEKVNRTRNLEAVVDGIGGTE